MVATVPRIVIDLRGGAGEKTVGNSKQEENFWRNKAAVLTLLCSRPVQIAVECHRSQRSLIFLIRRIVDKL